MDEFNDITSSEVQRLTNGLVDDITISATQLKEADDRYKSLMEQASRAKEQKIGIFSGKKVAIETLQDVALEQANMINELWVWHTKSLNHLKKLTESVQKLIFISTTSAAFTRAIIQELKNKTNGPITEVAKAQLLNVIKDLERQADAHDRINRIKEDIINLKKDNLSYKDSVALLMGSLENKYDRELAENQFYKFSKNFQELSNAINLMQIKEQTTQSQFSSILGDIQEIKNNVISYRKNLSIWKLISIGASGISILSILLNLFL